MDYIEKLMEQRQQFKDAINKTRKPREPKLDAKLRNKIANFLVRDQMGQEPTPAQVAFKAADFINEIVSSDIKNIFALSNMLQRFNQIYRKD